MIAAILLSVRQLGDPAVLRVLAGSLLLTLLLFAGAGYGLYAWATTDGACIATGPWRYCGRTPGLLGTLLVTGAAAWLLFPAVAIGVVGAFSDRIVAAVERRHYPRAAGAVRAPGTAQSIGIGARSAARLLGYNLVALPGYVLLLVTGVGPLLLAVMVNGCALARDLWEMVAVRHLPRGAMRAELRETRGLRLALGLVAAGLFVVPLLNLLAPVLGAAMATHLYHRRRR